MSPAISSFPWVDKDCDFVVSKTLDIFFNVFALFDLSFFIAASPSLAESIAFTSPAVFEITLIFKSSKSFKLSDVCDNNFSLACMLDNFEEQTQRRYVSFCVAQN